MAQVELVLGDLFQSQYETLVIPCSTAGTMSTPFIRGLEGLGVKNLLLPEGKLGTLLDQQASANFGSNIYHTFIFAISVDNQRSNYDAIQNIIKLLAGKTATEKRQTIACPLLGAGAGKLEADKVFNIIKQTFEANAQPQAKLAVYVNQEQLYQQLLRVAGEDELPKGENITTYAVGATWDGEDQYDRFMEEGIWENGHTKNFVEKVKNVNIGDVLILKYSSTERGGYLQIKAIGRVRENPSNGHLLMVDWTIQDLKVIVEGISAYRDTISPVQKDDLQLITEKLSPEHAQFALTGSETLSGENSVTVPSKIANLVSDATVGVDYLDIGKDIMAFAKVMAYKNFLPPLAIALFGKWGTGKSFFMQKLREKISDLTDQEEQKDYCQGIAQIHFNAWSYLDANLWASLVSRIFEGLQEYITGDDIAKEHKDAILAELTSQLVITYEEVSSFEAKKQEVQTKIDALESEQKKLQDSLKEKITAIETNSLSGVIKAIDDQFKIKEKLEQALNSNTSLQEDAENLKKIIPDEYWEHPEEFYKQLRSTSTFLQGFFQKKNIGWNIFFIVVILLTIFILPHIVTGLSSFLKSHDFSVPQLQTLVSLIVLLTPIITRAQDIIKRYRPYVAAVWDIKEKYQSRVAKAKEEFEQKEKSIQLEIKNKEQQLITINQSLQQAKTELDRIDYKIKNALATEALYSFIEKRCKSEDYKKMLGIVSIIRKDFETLSSLFAGHRDEKPNLLDDRFKRPLSRIILYIDDLDRCPEDRVVEVLEAVNLLMAYPLFIVVVGVDPRWVRNSLVKRYQLQFSSKTDHENGRMYEIMEASDYLEKIFQIPFHLKPATPASVKQMVRNLTAGFRVQNKEEVIDANETDQQEDHAIEQVNNVDNQAPHAANQEELKSTFELSNIEIQLLEEFSIIVGNNPRAIKRYVNTYQIVRCHEGFIYSEETKERDFKICLFLLALPTGKFRDLNESLVEYFDLEQNHKSLNNYLAESYELKNKNLNPLKRELEVLLSDKTIFDSIKKHDLSIFKRRYNFIRRFTFEDVDASGS